MVRLEITSKVVRSAMAVVALLGAGHAMGAASIVQDGRPNAEIIIARKAPRAVELAAEELQTALEKISGARLPVVREPAGASVRIFVGRSPSTERLNVSGDGLPHGGYRMVSGGDWLVLIGDDTPHRPREPYAHKRGDRDRVQKAWDKMTGARWACPALSKFKSHNQKLGLRLEDGRGSLNAVYGFLRSLGARWYFPGKFGECLPVARTLALPEVNETVRPEFAERAFGFSRFYFGNGRMEKGRALWYLRLGLRRETVIATHGIDYVIHHPNTRKNHPEFYMLVKGKRDTVSRGGKPCLSAPGLAEANAAFARAYLDTYDAKMVNVMPTDGYVTLCQCELCKGKSTPERGYRGLLSDYVWGYADKVARDLYKTHPDKLVSCGSYSAYKLPPRNIGRFSPNMAVRIKRNRWREYDPKSRKSARDLRNAWLEKLPGRKPIRMADNYSRAGAAGLPMYFPRLLAEDMRSLRGICESEYVEVNARSEYGPEPPVKLAVNHLNIYVTARLWWNTHADVDAMLEEYYKKFYGPAAAEMKAFIEFSEGNWWKMTREEEPIVKALGLLAAARKAAGEKGIHARRIALVDKFLRPLKQLREKAAMGRKNAPAVRAHGRWGRDIKIDGKLDDGFWRRIASHGLREIEKGRKPSFGTGFRVGWKNDGLYFGIRCQDPDAGNLNIATTKKDTMDIWNGDVVEILLETQSHAYYQIAINPSGAVFDADRARGLRSLWDSGAEVGVHVGKNFWSLEVRFPVADEMQEENLPDQLVSGRRPTRGQPWYFNIGRKRVRGKGIERSMFSPTGKPRFADPTKFGKLYVE